MFEKVVSSELNEAEIKEEESSMSGNGSKEEIRINNVKVLGHHKFYNS